MCGRNFELLKTDVSYDEKNVDLFIIQHLMQCYPHFSDVIRVCFKILKAYCIKLSQIHRENVVNI